MLYIERRICETLVCHIVVSVLVATLFYFGILQPGYKLSVLMLGVTALADIIFLVFFTSIYFKYTEEDTTVFYKTNLLALSFLIVPAILLALLDSVISLEPVYTFLFFPFKLGMIAVGMSKFISALSFSAILLMVTVIPPLFLSKVLPEEEIAPPIMQLEDTDEKDSK